jgi:hypothetical protein
MRRCCCCFWWILDRLLRTDCESLVALLVDARRCILCHVVNDAGCGCAPNGAAGDGEADCLVEKLSLLATVEGVAGYGIKVELELGLAFLDDAAALALAAAFRVWDVLTDADDVEARRPDRLLVFLGTTPPLLEDPAESSLAAPALSSGPKGDNAPPNKASFPQGEGAAPTASSTLAGPFFFERPILTTGVESPPLDSSELRLLLCPFPRAGRLDGAAGAGDAAAFLGLVPSDAAAFLGLVPNGPLFDRRVPRWLGVLVRDFIEGEAPLSSCNDRDDDPRAWGVWGGLIRAGIVPSGTQGAGCCSCSCCSCSCFLSSIRR